MQLKCKKGFIQFMKKVLQLIKPVKEFVKFQLVDFMLNNIL